MRDGIYKVHFKTQRGEGAGVVILQGGKLRGGDSGMYYIGTYQQNGDDFTADVETGVHTRTPGIGSVFGLDNVHIKLTGKTNGDSAQMSGKAREAANVSFHAAMTRIGD
ncbi:MAG: hypothetical protein HYZ11_18810 [Candidatus Tectomicrobia bacterium]|uniref:T3SS negative regulator,GrlR n=1 Tax=Tectimicrobiota bacterium TaxID=2528274 RepID=A0A932I4E3_UNCTE|nr:hypothetical protein [Candidatus Tectomicrobia bacterium]